MGLYLTLLETPDPEELELEEYDLLTDWHDLMVPALDYLVRQEKGLVSPHFVMHHALREAILLVDQEISRQKEERREEDQAIEEKFKELRRGV